MSLIPGVWDSTRWNQSQWFQPSPPNVAGWGDDWRFWVQYGPNPQTVIELTEMVIEARWTTDEHTMGDGTFRGDLQPGQLALRLWDPKRILDAIPFTALIFARYRPAAMTFVWFHDTLTRGLYPQSDPQAADCVINGLGWPVRLTAPSTFNRTPEPANSRMTAVVAAINAASTLNLPTVAGDIAAQSQSVGASIMVDTQIAVYPGYLQALRDAGVYGVVWLEGTGGDVDGSTGALAVRYRRWDTSQPRPLDPAQIIAGPAISRSVDFVLSQVKFEGDDPTTAAAESFTYSVTDSQAYAYGLVAAGPLRVWDRLDGTGPQWPVLISLAGQILYEHGQSQTYLSTVSCQSGARWLADGRPSTVLWNPAAHVWSPIEVMTYRNPAAGNTTQSYRVTKSDHTLNAAAWSTTHTLEWFVNPPAMP
jgi:hypothetical protein